MISNGQLRINLLLFEENLKYDELACLTYCR